MTRIGRVTVKLSDKIYAASVLQYVNEDGEGWTLAKFLYERPIFNGARGLMPGGMVRATHAVYRRAA